jgi:hypothetical protein
VFRLHSTLPKIKVLLGVREQQGVHFFESNAKREKVVKNLIDYAKLHYFDGIFFHFSSKLYVAQKNTNI